MTGALELEGFSAKLGNPERKSWVSTGWGFGVRPTPLLTYLLTPWSRVLYETLSGYKLVKKLEKLKSRRTNITTTDITTRIPISEQPSHEIAR